MDIDKYLKEYVEKEILTEYNSFDNAHNFDHVSKVIKNSLKIAENYKELNINMIYVIAVYHDLGIKKGRDMHEINSGVFLLADNNLKKWFSEDEILIMKEAVEDHRASNKNDPRSIYGEIISDADRDLNIDTILTRTYQYGLYKYPHFTKEEHIKRSIEHIEEKYGYEGYIKLRLNDEFNKSRLEKLRNLISNKENFLEYFLHINCL